MGKQDNGWRFYAWKGDFMIRRITSMSPQRAARLVALLFAGVFALLPLSVEAQTCKSGICLYESARVNGKETVTSIRFDGFPRTKQDYVTNFYQIRGLPWSVTHEMQIESKGGPYEFSGGANISIQACRRRGVVVHTFCTDWVSFKVY